MLSRWHGWPSGESTSLPPMWSGFDFRTRCHMWIGHFRVHLRLHFQARLSAKSLLWKSVFIHIEIGSNYHNKNFALIRLALKRDLRELGNGLLSLLVLYSAMRGFSPGTPVFPAHQKPTFDLIWIVNNNCKIVIWAILIWFPLEL